MSQQARELVLRLPTCPLCHTRDVTITAEMLASGSAWVCTRCSQTWTEARLRTVDAYERYAAGRRRAAAPAEAAVSVLPGG